MRVFHYLSGKYFHTFRYSKTPKHKTSCDKLPSQNIYRSNLPVSLFLNLKGAPGWDAFALPPSDSLARQSERGGNRVVCFVYPVQLFKYSHFSSPLTQDEQ